MSDLEFVLWTVIAASSVNALGVIRAMEGVRREILAAIKELKEERK